MYRVKCWLGKGGVTHRFDRGVDPCTTRFIVDAYKYMTPSCSWSEHRDEEGVYFLTLAWGCFPVVD